MKEDCNTFIVQKKVILRIWDDRLWRDPESAISTLATATGAPCIVIAFWLGEHLGFPDWIHKSINRLMAFYHYDEVLNKPQGYVKKDESSIS